MAKILLWHRRILSRIATMDPPNIGHVALRCEGAYVSWWPNREDGWFGIYSGQAHDRFALDAKAEGPGDLHYQLPDVRIPVSDLDEGAIAKWWGKEKLGGDWRIWRRNCATVVAEALNVGGFGRLHPDWDSDVRIWTPERLAAHVKDALVAALR